MSVWCGAGYEAKAGGVHAGAGKPGQARGQHG